MGLMRLSRCHQMRLTDITGAVAYCKTGYRYDPTSNFSYVQQLLGYNYGNDTSTGREDPLTIVVRRTQKLTVISRMTLSGGNSRNYPTMNVEHP